MEKYLIDSNIFIYNFQENQIAKEFLINNFRLNNILSFSFVTRLELMLFNLLKAEEKTRIDNLLLQLTRIDYNKDIEELILKNAKYRKFKIPDAIIAASAILTESTLVTRNTKDFQNIPGLKLFNPFESD